MQESKRKSPKCTISNGKEEKKKEEQSSTVIVAF